MPSSYPSGLDALQRVAAGDSMQSTSHSGLHNSQSDAIEAIQAVLGLNPQGGSATVGARCAALESGKASLSGSVSFGGTVGGTGLSGSLLSSASPVMNGTAAAGTATVPSRQDHVHPSDTSRAALSGATFTGDTTVSKASPTLGVNATSGDPIITIDGAAGTLRSVRFRTGTSLRWLFGASSTAESGSDAGSDFRLRRHNDAGAGVSDPFFVWRNTGKVTFGDVGASAGIEYGTSGPRDMVGTGSPEGVVTAPVGSTWRDTNATTGAIKWIKASGTGSTGWVVEYGDTGLRDVSGQIRAAHLALNPNAKAYIRRVGNQVSFIYYNGASATATGVQTITDSGAVPAGFQFTKFAAAIAPTGSCINGSSGALGPSLYFAAAAQIVSATHSSGASYNGQIRWDTDAAWPSTLPGTAA